MKDLIKISEKTVNEFEQKYYSSNVCWCGGEIRCFRTIDDDYDNPSILSGYEIILCLNCGYGIIRDVNRTAEWKKIRKLKKE